MKIDLRLNRTVAGLIDSHRGEMSVQAYINHILKQTLQSHLSDTSDCKHDNSYNANKANERSR